MNEEITPISEVGSGSAVLGHLADQARDYFRQAKAPNARRAYASDWHHFAAWCVRHQRTDLPASPETVALYLSG